MTEQQMKDWIDAATYEQLLSKWRFEPAGSPWFQGKMGDYFSVALDKRRAACSPGEQVAASKNVGW